MPISGIKLFLLLLLNISVIVFSNLSNYGTKHRVFIASLMVAFKMFNQHLGNKCWSELTGIFSVTELIQIENQFLNLIDYNIWITKQDLCFFFKKYHSDLSVN